MSSQVATTVKLIVEPATEDELVDLYMSSFLAGYADEKCLGVLFLLYMFLVLIPGQLHQQDVDLIELSAYPRKNHGAGEGEAYCTALCGHFFDSAMFRGPIIPSFAVASSKGQQDAQVDQCHCVARLKLLKKSTVQSKVHWNLVELGCNIRRTRFHSNPDGAPTWNDSDIMLMNDGGRPGQLHNFGFIELMEFIKISITSQSTLAGNKCHLCNIRVGEQVVQKSERCLTIVYDEDSLMQRKDAWSCLPSSHHCHVSPCPVPELGLWIQNKLRTE